jgi:hypothetical protein
MTAVHAFAIGTVRLYRLSAIYRIGGGEEGGELLDRCEKNLKPQSPCYDWAGVFTRFLQMKKSYQSVDKARATTACTGWFAHLLR